MISIEQDIQRTRTTLAEFIDLSSRILGYLPAVLSGMAEKSGYLLYFSSSANTKRQVRPINKALFIMETKVFDQKTKDFLRIIGEIRSKVAIDAESDLHIIDSVLYTIQQSIGAAFDLLVEPNSARKHVGNRFEELMKALFTEIGIPNKRVLLKIPYESEDGEKTYTCENDLILSPSSDLRKVHGHAEILLEVTNSSQHLEDEKLVLTPDAIRSAQQFIGEKEVVVSVKTTSKDRMGKMFMDKILLERFVQHELKVIGIFLNDVQRKGVDNISYTLVSGLFMVYNKFITELDGVYYLDPPPNANREPYNKYIKRFSLLITKDMDVLLSS